MSTNISSTSSSSTSSSTKNSLKPSKILNFRTNDVPAFARLMYALRDLTETARFFYDDCGIKLREQACCDSLCLYANFDSKQFISYKAIGKGILCFTPRILHLVISKIGQGSEMEFKFNSVKETKMVITVYRESGDIEQSYELDTLLTEDNGWFDALEMEMDYILAFKTSIMNDIYSCLMVDSDNCISDWVKMKCEPNKLVFSLEGMNTNCSIALLTNKGKECLNDDEKKRRNKKKNFADEVFKNSQVPLLNSQPRDTVISYFRLKHLQQLMKCFSINEASIILYIRQDNPLIFEVQVGLLGKLKLALLTKSHGEVLEELSSINNFV